MKLRLTLPLLLITIAFAQEKPAPAKPAPPPASTAAPTLSSDQKAELADALTNLIEAQSQLEHLPGYTEYSTKAQTAQIRMQSLQQSACKSAGKQQYQLSRNVDPASGKTEWSCKENPAPAAAVKK